MAEYSIISSIRKDKPIKRNGKYPIYLRIRVGIKETKVSAHLDVRKEQWDDKKNRGYYNYTLDSHVLSPAKIYPTPHIVCICFYPNPFYPIVSCEKVRIFWIEVSVKNIKTSRF